MTIADELLAQGRQHARKRAWDAAIMAYQEVLDLEPENAGVTSRAHYALAGVYQLQERFEQAEAHYRAALQADSRMAEAYYDLGQCYKSQDRLAEAQAAFERYVDLSEKPREIAEVRALLATMMQQPFATCERCGDFTTLSRMYKTTTTGKLCPRCVIKNQTRSSLFTWLFIGLTMVLCVVPGWFADAAPPPWHYLYANIVLSLLVNYAMIIPHELAHAVAAWALKGRVFEICIGLGPVLWQKTLRGVRISLRKYPIAGFCVLSFPTRTWIGVRAFLATSAGIVFSALMVVLFLPGFWREDLTSMYAWSKIVVWVNFIQLLFNVLPRKVQLGSTASMTDGGQMLQILLGKLSPTIYQLGHFLHESMYAWQARAYAPALAAAEAGLALFPDNVPLKNIQAIVYLEQGRYEESAALFKRLLTTFEKDAQADDALKTLGDPDAMRALLLNNYAEAALFLPPDADLLREIYTCAQQAYMMLPWHDAIESTWGAVLIHTGRPKLALHHLQAALAQQDTAASKANTLAFMALAHQRLGAREEATACMARAVALDAESYVVRHLRNSPALLEDIDASDPNCTHTAPARHTRAL